MTTAYDTSGNLTALTSYLNGSGSANDGLAMTFDLVNRPQATTRGATQQSAYAYNPDGTVASLTLPAGTTTYGYDLQDRLTSADPPSSTALGWTWRNDGLLASRSWPGGALASTTYDGTKRPSGLTIVNGATTLAIFSRGYDRAGNATSEGQTLTGISGLAGSGSQSFSYDAVNRLTASSVGSDARSYTYDAGSRRLTATVNGVTTTTAYDRTGAATSETVAGDTRPFVYDAYGNLTSRPIDHATGAASVSTYDLEDHLTRVGSGGGAGESYDFTIDAAGRPWARTKDNAGSPDATYGYLGLSDVVARITAATPVDAALDPGGSRLATVAGAASGFTIPDLHGNLAATLASAGTSIAGGTRYDGYGVALADVAASVPRPWGYQGRLNLVDGSAQARATLDFDAREYQPDLGAFTGFDSLSGGVSDPLSLNRYLYAAANPATLVDPDGHRAEQGWNPDIHGSNVAPITPGPSHGGLLEGADPTPHVSSHHSSAWTQAAPDMYYNGTATVQNYLEQTHGADALQTVSGLPRRTDDDIPGSNMV